MSTWSFVVNSIVPVFVIWLSLVTPYFEIEFTELRVAGMDTKAIVALPMAFHVMNCKAFKKVKYFIVTSSKVVYSYK